MLSTPFSSHIIDYEPPREFIVPKFSAYDGSSDPFNHIMHYRQLMTLEIGNDMLLCKVFPANLQDQALSWFHRLPINSVDNFRDLSEAFVGHTLQNIKMQENESLREFVKRFGQVVLQVESYNIDAVLQIFKRSICPGTPFFESLAKKPTTTMDDLFRRANKYSMLEYDVRAATQQILVTGQAARCDGPRAPLAPVRAIINYIHGGPLDEEYNSKRKRQRLLRVATAREHVSSIRPSLANGSAHPIDGAIVFSPIDHTRVLQPYRDALILTLGIRDFAIRRILNPRRILSGFNGVSTTSLGDITLPIQARPVILNAQFFIVEYLSPFNAILGRTWLHNMKVIPSIYHQMVSFITQDGQIDLYGSQLKARQCYQVAQETGPNVDREHSPKEANQFDQ
uniref:Retrotransposon gag domain-containing protein n=1 Tax=Vitis vinifera TaxID=29760 RepID=A5BSM4_VITVI|nr:hypothetical protein VITISV_014972 [Vitis vinifera]